MEMSGMSNEDFEPYYKIILRPENLSHWAHDYDKYLASFYQPKKTIRFLNRAST